MAKSKVQLLEKEKKVIVTFDKEDLVRFGLIDYLRDKDRSTIWQYPFEKKATELFRRDNEEYEVKKPEQTKVYETKDGPEVQVSLYVNRFSRTETPGERLENDPKLIRKNEILTNFKQGSLRIKIALSPYDASILYEYIKEGLSFDAAKNKLKPMVINRVFDTNLKKMEAKQGPFTAVDKQQLQMAVEEGVEKDIEKYRNVKAASKKYCSHCGANLKTAIISITPYSGNPESQLGSNDGAGYGGGGGVPAPAEVEDTTFPTMSGPGNKSIRDLGVLKGKETKEEEVPKKTLIAILDLDGKGKTKEDIAEITGREIEEIKEIIEESKKLDKEI